MANKLKERLKQLRASAGVTQEQLARAANVARSTIARFETTQAEITPGTAAAIAKGLGIEHQTLIDYLDGKISVDVALLESTVRQWANESREDPGPDPLAFVSPGHLERIAVSAFRSSPDVSIESFDIVRTWLSELESTGVAGELRTDDVARNVIREMFKVAAVGENEAPLIRVLLGVCRRLSHLAFALPDGADVSAFISEHLRSAHKTKNVKTSILYADHYRRAREFCSTLTTDGVREFFGPMSQLVATFLQEEMHDDEFCWQAIVSTLRPANGAWDPARAS